MDDFVRQWIVENSAPWRPPYPWGNLPPRDDVRTLARDWTSDRIAAIEANCGVALLTAGILRKTPAGTWQFTTGLTPGQPFILLQDEPGALPFAVLTGEGLLGDLRPPIAVTTCDAATRAALAAHRRQLLITTDMLDCALLRVMGFPVTLDRWLGMLDKGALLALLYAPNPEVVALAPPEDTVADSSEEDDRPIAAEMEAARLVKAEEPAATGDDDWDDDDWDADDDAPPPDPQLVRRWIVVATALTNPIPDDPPAWQAVARHLRLVYLFDQFKRSHHAAVLEPLQRKAAAQADPIDRQLLATAADLAEQIHRESSLVRICRDQGRRTDLYPPLPSADQLKALGAAVNTLIAIGKACSKGRRR
jgi:hypothetical protein